MFMRYASVFLKMLIILSLFSYSCKKETPLSIVSNTINNKEIGTGVNPEDFFFSWKLASVDQNVLQTAYQIVVATDGDFSETATVWNSSEITEEQSILVKYAGKTLKNGTTYFWKVKVWDNKGNESDWKVGKFTTGLFSGKDWGGAKWIAMDSLKKENRIVPGVHQPGKKYKGNELGLHKLPILRKKIEVKKNLKEALVFVSGLGHYELNLNGVKVGDNFMAPGWTHYDETALYNTFDVTAQLKQGENAFGVFMGNGFFIVPNDRYKKVMTAYGNPMMILKLQLIYTDGTTDWMVSDTSWKAAPGPITFSSIYGGENYNATLEQEGWDTPEFNDTDWKNAIAVQTPCNKLLPETDYPVKLMESIEVKKITQIEDIENTYIYDFGQNASGVFEIEVKGKRGDSIHFTPAELIDEKSHVNQKATGRKHYYTYVLKGDGVEKWQPRFTYYGYRYLEVEGATMTTDVKKDLPQILDIKMLHNRNSNPEVGSFLTSFELFNEVNGLIKWAIKSNMQSALTDCPHREKLGWLEQAYLMGEGVHFNYDVYSLYNKIVDDMIVAQTPNGLVPNIVPEYTVFDFMDGIFRDSPEWGSASIIVPWLIYKWYGDIDPIKRAWPMMVHYMDYLEGKSKKHILDHGLGDWYDLGPERPGFSQLTPRSLTATAIYFYDAQLMVEIAKLLGKTVDVKKYASMAKDIKWAFNDTFYDPETKMYSTGSQTAIAMPLVIGLVDEKEYDAVVQTLVQSIHNSGNALTAGDIGFNYLVKALQSNNQGELLYEMNARDDVPGYGYQLKKGATALTESWPALDNVSNNHLMLGHIMEWFYNGLGGIGQTEKSVAYKEVKIEPQVVGGIKSAQATYESPYGTIHSEWHDTDGKFKLKVKIPANTSAVIVLPAKNVNDVLQNEKAVPANQSFMTQKGKDKLLNIKIGSGVYNFTVNKK